MKTIASWGNYPRVAGTCDSFRSEEELQETLRRTPRTIARGAARSYGDSSLGEHMCSTLAFDKMLAFDPIQGTLTCQSGVLLKDILDVIVPRGWFLAVVPGTAYVSVGGAIASDIHGKNHHTEGSFSRSVTELDLMFPDGSVVRASRAQNQELFAATCGGMGLTGIILRATMRLKPIETPYIKKRTVSCGNLLELMGQFEAHAATTYTVAWIDCFARNQSLGRGIFFGGEHATKNELARHHSPLRATKQKARSLPFFLPHIILTAPIMRAANASYYHLQRLGPEETPERYERFFFPLDTVLHWNRLYGKRGFLQYQCVIPKQRSEQALREMLLTISASGHGSFLGVLKLLGKESEGLLSFPMEGYTLALDFPIRRGVFEFLKTLDTIVMRHEGRLYLTKDSRMPKEMFLQGYPKNREFRTVVEAVSKGKFESLQSARLQMT